MAEKTSLSLSMTDTGGNKLSKAVTDVNPNASNSALNAFAQGLAGLTTNTLVNTSKITKEDLNYDYELIFEITKMGNADYFTKVDNNTYNIDASKLPTDSATGDGMAIRVSLSQSGPNITNQVFDSIRYSIIPAANEKSTAYLSVFTDQTNNNFSIYLCADGEVLEDIAGSKTVIHFNGGTYGEHTYAPADLTFNFV